MSDFEKKVQERTISYPMKEDKIEPYASIYVAGIQPLGGWTGKTSEQRLLEIEKNSIPILLRIMKEDWGKICKKYIGTDFWEDTLCQLPLSNLPKILAYDQPFLTSLFKKYQDLFIELIEVYFDKNEKPKTNDLLNLISLKISELMIKNGTDFCGKDEIPVQVKNTFEKTSFTGLKIFETITRQLAKINIAENTDKNVTEILKEIDLISQVNGWQNNLRFQKRENPELIDSIKGFNKLKVKEFRIGLKSLGLLENDKLPIGSFIKKQKIRVTVRKDGKRFKGTVVHIDNNNPVPSGFVDIKLDNGYPSEPWITNEKGEFSLPADTMSATISTEYGRITIVKKQGEFVLKKECNFDIELITLDLYRSLLKIPFVSNTVQRILDDAFETLEKHYQFLALRTLSFDQLKYTKTPIAFIDLYREHMYDLGTFLGPSLDHVWNPPFSEVEMTESVSITEYSSVENEAILETFEESETTSSTKQDFLNELQKEREKSFNINSSMNASYDVKIFSTGGTTSIDHSSRTNSVNKEVTNKVIEESQRVANNIKRSSRTTSFQSREVKNENIKRRTIKNPEKGTSNYEIRRKYQKIGIGLEYIGTRLSWLIYIDNPKRLLTLSKLFHPVRATDLSDIPKPEFGQLDLPRIIQEEEEFSVPFDQEKGDETKETYYYGIDKKDGGDDEHVNQFDIEQAGRHKPRAETTIQHEFIFTTDIPKIGYELKEVQWTANYRGDGRIGGESDIKNPDPFIYIGNVTNGAKGEFEIILKEANFNDAARVYFSPKLIFEPGLELIKKIDTRNDELLAEWDKEKQDKSQYEEALRLKEQIEREHSISRRDSIDLRAEERYVILRAIAQKLTQQSDNKEEQVLSDLLRTLFDIEKMVYFVAPDWWEEKKLSEYNITDESEPARFGASLGWEMQLDGDDQRNAFINSSFVRVALPVRQGMTFEALSWLVDEKVEGNNISDELKEELKDDLVKNLLNEKFEPDGQIEARIPEITFSEFGTFTQDGVNTVTSGEDDDPRGKIISSWKEIVPTKQTVAVEVDYVYENGQLKPKY